MKTSLCVAAGVALVGWLFLGIFQHREYGTHSLFVKHRPAFKFFFSSPIGESEIELSELSAVHRHEETMYRAFIEEGRGFKRSIPLWW